MQHVKSSNNIDEGIQVECSQQNWFLCKFINTECNFLKHDNEAKDIEKEGNILNVLTVFLGTILNCLLLYERG